MDCTPGLVAVQLSESVSDDSDDVGPGYAQQLAAYLQTSLTATQEEIIGTHKRSTRLTSS